MDKNVIFILSGNCRTFIQCFDSLYTNIISKLFSEDFNIHVYLYLKLKDPGPKGQLGWDFEYKDVDYDTLINNINIFKNKYLSLKIEYKILSDNEISDNELLSQVKTRSLYNKENYRLDKTFLRGLHCHYNFEKCGIYITEKEKNIGSKFEYIVYVRPDLFFTECCNNIESYNKSIVTIAEGPGSCHNDHMAIIPRVNLNAFFFERINLYRNNTTHNFISPEEVYCYTIAYEEKKIGKYYIKRT
jgi:hypothetical protein